MYVNQKKIIFQYAVVKDRMTKTVLLITHFGWTKTPFNIQGNRNKTGHSK